MRDAEQRIRNRQPAAAVALPLGDRFDLDAILNSGQVFHWKRAEPEGPADAPAFFGCIGDELVHVAQSGPELRVEPAGSASRVTGYFRLDEDWEAMRRTFPPDDPVLAAAVAFCPGLRLVRQPLWECLATFLTSSLKQVAHIRQISLGLRAAYGRERRLGSLRAQAYPEPGVLAAAGEEALRRCGLGYRARAVHRAAVRLDSGEIDLESARDLDDTELLEFLCGLYGVGEKIAHCVMLFGYGRMKAFPVDVWMERILRERYFPGKRGQTMTRQDLAKFASNHFGEYGGYAQQFLFHYARKSLGRSL